MGSKRLVLGGVHLGSTLPWLSLSACVPFWCCSCPPQPHLLLLPQIPPPPSSLLPPWMLRCCSTMKTSPRKFCPGRKDSSLVLFHLAELVWLEPGFKYSPTHLLEQTIWWLSTLILRFLVP